MNGFLHDANGDKSSKRLWGSIILAVAVLMSLILFGYSLHKGAVDADTATSIINAFFITGGSLLGVGVLENGVFKKNDK